MITSPAILDELVDVLTRPKLCAQARLTFEDVARIRVGLQQFAETVPGRIATWMPFRRIRRTTLLSRPL